NSSGILTVKTSIGCSSGTLTIDNITATSDVDIEGNLNTSGALLVTGNIASSGTITAVTGLASSSGTLDVLTSTLRGTVTVSSDININNTLTMSSGMAVPVVEGTTTVAASSGYFVMQPYGHSYITVDSTDPHVWVLPAPVAGARKTVQQAVTISTSNPNSVVCVSGVTMITTGGINLTKWNGYVVGASLDLVANSATEWSVIGHNDAGIAITAFEASTST
ncbi:hypothetical protein LCGC14_1699480, partial [marine sediment metagenome]